MKRIFVGLLTLLMILSAMSLGGCGKMPITEEEVVGVWRIVSVTAEWQPDATEQQKETWREQLSVYTGGETSDEDYMQAYADSMMGTYQLSSYQMTEGGLGTFSSELVTETQGFSWTVTKEGVLLTFDESKQLCTVSDGNLVMTQTIDGLQINITMIKI